MAASLVRGKFGLGEMEPDVYNDPAILALGDKVTYEIDPKSEYPKYFSGEVVITLNDGRELRHREHINRGAADRPIVRDDIVIKYRDTAQMAISRARADAVCDAVLRAEEMSARALEATLANPVTGENN